MIDSYGVVVVVEIYILIFNLEIDKYLIENGVVFLNFKIVFSNICFLIGLYLFIFYFGDYIFVYMSLWWLFLFNLLYVGIFKMKVWFGIGYRVFRFRIMVMN